MSLHIAWQATTTDSLVLDLRGEIDYASAAELRTAISTAVTRHPRPPAIVVDLSSVTFVDRVGAGTLIVAERICRQIGIDLVFKNPSPVVRRVLAPRRATASGHADDESA